MTARRIGCLGVGLAILLAGALLLVVTERRPAPARPWIAEGGYELGYLDMGGRRLRFARAGSGPSIVLLHGFASSVYTWKDVIPALAASHDVVAIDFPGFGDSSIPDPLDAATYPATVIDVMDRLRIARATLVGNSMGGSVAVGVAAQWPDRVDHLVLIDSAGFNFAAKDRPWLLRAMAAPGVAPLLEMLPVRRRVVAAGLRQVFHDDTLVTDERIDAYAEPMMRAGAARAAAQVLSRRRVELPFARVRAPTLVIWGGDDTWIPVAHAQHFVDAIPGARAVILEACGHMPQEERPGEVAALIDRFLGPPPRVD